LFKKLHNFITAQFYLDQKSWILWLIAFFCFGIILYFSLPTEPSFYIEIIIFLAISITVIICRRKNFVWLPILLLCLSIGLMCATYRTINVLSPKLNEEIKLAKIYGRVLSITPVIKGFQVVLDKIYIKDFGNKKFPKKAKITIKGNNKLDEIEIGDYIKFRATLRPSSKPFVPRGYDFSKQNFFDQIGATGYNNSNIYVIKKNHNKVENYISNLRIYLSKRIKNVLGEKNGSIATALIIGEQSAIDKAILSDMRISGLTHILSVSGLHLSIVSIICIFCIRFLLSFSIYICQKYDTKKIAAYFSLLFTLGYLLISGMQIAALRSYIMVVCVITAVLLDRQEYALRSVCLAALIILLINPESITHPSFQMSFTAVIALVSGYEYYLTKFFSNTEYTNFDRIKRYFFGTLAATFIAGLATAPFAIYHFNQYANYSILANLIVAPVTSFIIMPSVVLTCILFPFGLEKLSLWILNYGIEFLIYIANKVSQLPKALIMLPNMNIETLMLFVIGLFWLCLWQQKWRFFGVIPIITAIILLLITPRPDLIIDAHTGIILLRSSDNNLVRTENKRRLSDFMQDYFNARMQTNQIISINNKKYLEEFNCDAAQCFIDNNYKLHFPRNSTDLLLKIKLLNNKEILVSDEDLKRNGSYFITLKPNEPKIESVIESLQYRPWS
jgi:competence protein ComEC